MCEITKKFVFSEKDDGKHRLICRECRRETLHSIVCSYNERGSQNCDGGYSVDWDCKNQIIQCLGCETVSFRTISTCSEDMDCNDDGMYYPEAIKYYPGRSVGLKSIESDLLPYNIRKIYEETMLSIDNKQYILAGIGMRAIVETVCKDQGIDGSNLEKRIDGLATKGVLSKAQADILHTHRFLGNAAAHEITSAKPRELVAALDIAENILRTLYVLPELSKQVTTGRITT